MRNPLVRRSVASEGEVGYFGPKIGREHLEEKSSPCGGTVRDAPERASRQAHGGRVLHLSPCGVRSARIERCDVARKQVPPAGHPGLRGGTTPPGGREYG